MRVKLFGVMAAAMVCLAAPAFAEDVHVVTGGGTLEALKDLQPAYEKKTGNKLIIETGQSSGTGPTAIPTRLDRGDAIELVVMTRDGLDAQIAKGKVVADSLVDLARARNALAAKKGAPKADISTPAKLKQVLLDAKSVAYSEGAKNTYVTLFKTLGIEQEMVAKSKIGTTSTAGQMVANGEAELGFQQISELRPLAGIEILGPVPAEVLKVTTYTMALTTTGKDSAGAKALLAFLATPAAHKAIEESGLEPATAKAP